MLTEEIPPGDATDISCLQGTVDLDAGEVELIAACLADPQAILISGDKRALRALVSGCPPDISVRLHGRVVCLEQLLVLIARRTSCAIVVQGVLANRELDTAIRAVVAPGGCTEAQFFEGMDAYVAHLRTETANLLLQT